MRPSRPALAFQPTRPCVPADPLLRPNRAESFRGNAYNATKLPYFQDLSALIAFERHPALLPQYLYTFHVKGIYLSRETYIPII